jgi:hypothetical protein
MKPDMRSEIPAAVIHDLQRIGLEPLIADTVIARLLPFDWINRLHWKDWDSVTKDMAHDQLVFLAKGLVRSEQVLKWSGGSVAAAIWVFRMFQSRFPEESDPLAEWMLVNSDNAWVPFGTNRGSARSLPELESDRNEKRVRQRANEEDAELQRHLRQVRKSVRDRIASERHAIQAGSSSARQQLLDKLSSLSLCERLHHLAWDDVHPINFYPTELAEGAIQQIGGVDRVSLKRLVSKAVARQRGPWRAWVNRLRKACAENSETDIAKWLEDVWTAK